MIKKYIYLGCWYTWQCAELYIKIAILHIVFGIFFETSNSWFYLRLFLAIILMMAQITLVLAHFPRLNPGGY